MNTFPLYDLFAAAYLLATGIPVVSTYWDGNLVQIDFDNTDGQASLAAQTYRDTNPSVPSRDLLTAYKTLQTLVRRERMGARA